MSCLYPQNDDPVHTQVLTIIGQVFVSLSLIFLLATIIIFVINKYVSKFICICKFFAILGLFGFGIYTQVIVEHA